MPKDIYPKGSVAIRIKTLRKAVGLSRLELEVNHNVKSPSLVCWENGQRIPKRDKAELLASIFKNYGIPCTVDWILKGKGPDPIEEAAKNPEDAYLLKEVYRFQSFYKDSLVIQAEDHHMAPWVNKGDFVGGIFVDQKEWERFIGQPCIVKVRDLEPQIRLIQKSTLDGSYNLISFSKKGDILNVELETIARIVFLRKK